MKTTISLILIIIAIPIVGFGQDQTVSGLKSQLKDDLSSKEKVEIYITLANEIADEEEWTMYNQMALDLCVKELESAKGEEKSFFLKNKADATANQGFYYDEHGQQSKALEHYFRALKMYDEAGAEEAKSSTLGNIGVILSNQKDYDEAEEYLQKALDLKLKHDPKNVAVNYINLGAVMDGKGEIDQALEYYELAAVKAEESGDYDDWATATNNIGAVFYKKKQFKESAKYMRKAIELYRMDENASGVAWAYGNLAESMFNLNKMDSALIYNLEAKRIADELQYPSLTANIAQNLFKVYNATSNWKDALEMYRLYTKMSDSILGIDAQKAALKQKLEYDHELEKQLINVQKEEGEKRYRLVVIFSTVGVIMFIIFILVLYKRFREEKKQKQIIQENRNEIIDSINYAKRLQQAILPTTETLKRPFKDAFVLYKPKDIIGGDFYWVYEHDGKTTLAVADCTGHGVPGALVSVVCANALDQVVKVNGVRKPNEILDLVRDMVINSFEHGDAEVSDGMDIAIVTLNGMELEYAGAYNPLWISNKDEIIVYKADRQPVGKFERAKPFSNNTVSLKSGDMFYIFSDGFADQFGGDEGKKFKSANLKRLLQEISALSLEEQQEKLTIEFDQWRGELPQIDDVCIVGVRV